MTLRIVLPLLAAGLAWTTPHTTPSSRVLADSPTRASRVSRSTPTAVQADSIVLDITNSMPHPLAITYEAHGDRKPLGTVAAGSERLLTIHDLQGDSVVVWATSGIPPHDMSHMFPTHAPTKLTWDL